jgi:hypothetical protein
MFNEEAARDAVRGSCEEQILRLQCLVTILLEKNERLRLLMHGKHEASRQEGSR